jgi:hypothetical protein
MVTHSSTSRPVQCLCMAERTGCPVFTDLWSYVLTNQHNTIIKDKQKCPRLPPRAEQVSKTFLRFCQCCYRTRNSQGRDAFSLSP